MMGSPAIGAWVAHLAFWILTGWGLFTGELSPRAAAVFLLLWLAGFFGLPYAPYGAALFAPFVAVLDIVLVIMVFKGDVRLT